MKIIRWMVGATCVAVVGAFVPAVAQAQSRPEPAYEKVASAEMGKQAGGIAVWKVDRR
ncbi:MAG: hypothetical protein V3T56_01335 [Gemmatimonadales bacterium]